MRTPTKKIFAIVVAISVMFTLTACTGAVDDNHYGGKTYWDGVNRQTGEYTSSRALPKQFPSDKIPVLANGAVGGFEAVYDKYKNLISAKLLLHTRKSSKEAIDSYKEYYSDVDEVIEDEIIVNEYVEEFTSYRYSFVKETYTYEVSVGRSAGAKYSYISVEMKQKK